MNSENDPNHGNIDSSRLPIKRAARAEKPGALSPRQVRARMQQMPRPTAAPGFASGISDQRMHAQSPGPAPALRTGMQPSSNGFAQANTVDPSGFSEVPPKPVGPFRVQRRCSNVERRAMLRMAKNEQNRQAQLSQQGSQGWADADVRLEVAEGFDSWNGGGESWGTRIEPAATYTSGTGMDGMEASSSFSRFPFANAPRFQEASQQAPGWNPPGSQPHDRQARWFPQAPRTWEDMQPVHGDGSIPEIDVAFSEPSQQAHGDRDDMRSAQDRRFRDRFSGMRSSEYQTCPPDVVQQDEDLVRVIHGVAVDDKGVQCPTPRPPEYSDAQSSSAPVDDKGVQCPAPRPPEYSDAQSSSAPGTAQASERGNGSSAPASGRSSASGRTAVHPVPASGRSSASGRTAVQRTVADLSYPTGVSTDLLPILEEGMRKMADTARSGSEMQAREAWLNFFSCAIAQTFTELEVGWQLDFSGEKRVEEKTAECLSRMANRALRRCSFAMVASRKASRGSSIHESALASRCSELQVREAELEVEIAKEDQRIADLQAAETSLASQPRELAPCTPIADMLREASDDAVMRGQEAGLDSSEFSSRWECMLKRFILARQTVDARAMAAEEEKSTLEKHLEALAPHINPQSEGWTGCMGLKVLGNLR